MKETESDPNLVQKSGKSSKGKSKPQQSDKFFRLSTNSGEKHQNSREQQQKQRNEKRPTKTVSKYVNFL